MAVKEYLNVHLQSGEKTSKTQLLLLVVKPISKSSTSRWIKLLIQEAGVGEQISIQGAASTAVVMKGMSIYEVIQLLMVTATSHNIDIMQYGND